jgi:non-heme chloroperoxidase
MGGAIVMHYIAKFFSELVSKVVLMGAAAPSFTKRENYLYGLEKSACDDLIIQSNHDRPRMVMTLARCSSRVRILKAQRCQSGYSQ